MANLRQATLVGEEEGHCVIAEMGLGNEPMPPGLQAENLIISGMPDFSYTPSATLLTFFSPEGVPRKASLHVVAPNNPCGQPHANIVSWFKSQGLKPSASYLDVAKGRRGLVAEVKTTGEVWPDDIMLAWAHG